MPDSPAENFFVHALANDCRNLQSRDFNSTDIFSFGNFAHRARRLCALRRSRVLMLIRSGFRAPRDLSQKSRHGWLLPGKPGIESVIAPHLTYLRSDPVV